MEVLILAVTPPTEYYVNIFIGKMTSLLYMRGGESRAWAIAAKNGSITRRMHGIRPNRYALLYILYNK